MRRTLLNLKIAIHSLGSFKLRTALAVLGVFFGTFSLIVVSNLADSLALKTEEEINNLGNNLVVVLSGQVRRYGPNVPLISRAMTLTPGDAEAIIESLLAAARRKSSSASIIL
jgi:putative ABC transport system permease protein